MKPKDLLPPPPWEGPPFPRRHSGNPEYHTIRIHKETVTRLDKFRLPGQSYDGIISELLDLGEKVDFEKRRYWK